jgi:hypothetical protein
MMTATEMRNKAIEVQTEAIKAEKAEAIAWVENEASPIIEEVASKGEFRTSITTKKFSERQMIEICNYFRKHGYTAVRSDAETLKVSW